MERELCCMALLRFVPCSTVVSHHDPPFPWCSPPCSTGCPTGRSSPGAPQAPPPRPTASSATSTSSSQGSSQVRPRLFPHWSPEQHLQTHKKPPTDVLLGSPANAASSPLPVLPPPGRRHHLPVRGVGSERAWPRPHTFHHGHHPHPPAYLPASGFLGPGPRRRNGSSFSPPLPLGAQYCCIDQLPVTPCHAARPPPTPPCHWDGLLRTAGARPGQQPGGPP